MVDIHVGEESFTWNQRRRLGGARSGSDLERVIMFCFILIFCGALVTGIFSTVLYASQLNEISNVRMTQCTVLSQDLIPYDKEPTVCYHEVCTNEPNGSVKCTFEPLPCFVAQWKVEYSQVDAEGENVKTSKVQSYAIDPPVIKASDAQTKLQKYAAGKAYKCSYSADQPLRVWWGHQSTDTWLITMIVSWGVVGMFLCALGFGWFFSKPIET